MRKRFNRITWNVTHIEIDMLAVDSINSSKKQSSMTREEFLNNTVDALLEAGYTPRDDVSRMRTTFKSPYSDSEYYTFLKVEGEKRLKVVLDIRLTDHFLKEWGKYSGRDRHLHYMKEETIPDIASEKNLDDSATVPEFYDISEQNSELFNLISIDGKFFNNYNDAFDEIQDKINDLPK